MVADAFSAFALSGGLPPRSEPQALARLLHGLCEFGPHQAVLLSDGAKAFGHAALHALQAAHVDVGLLILATGISAHIV